ncbi:riboflavin synthase [Candidatus Zinderia endosymbiont of Aphrophora alni]|uniref:riboflavin synthase n=1 Tax=Candidatus Zinderia endosymbiont of Aphrophora alni TaxID=3077951 RepID=UPI0030D1F2BD
MFTGIINNIGIITKIKKKNKNININIEAQKIFIKNIKLGDSISINGVCTTIFKKNNISFNINISKETLKKIKIFNKFEKINLEEALTINKKINGHLLSGHIDDIGKIKNIQNINESYKFIIKIPNFIKNYIIYKGSIAINGVSLTINKIFNIKKKNYINLNIIPYTMNNTIFKHMKINDNVNIEVDFFSKYIENIIYYKKIIF